MGYIEFNPSGGGGGIALGTWSGGEVMRLSNSSPYGLGIFTTTPGALLDIGNAGTKLGTMRLEGNTSGYVQIQPAAAAGSWTMTLPATAGTSTYVLSTDGAGVTSWVASGGSPAGSNTQVQFNSGGSFGASANMTWNGTKFHLTGNIEYSGVITDVSDRRAKDNIKPLSNQLEKVTQLQGISFTMKADPKQETELGLIAQDVEPLYPDLVKTDSDGMKAMNYIGLIAPLIEAVKEQQAQIAMLKAVGITLCLIVAALAFLLFRVWRVARPDNKM